MHVAMSWAKLIDLNGRCLDEEHMKVNVGNDIVFDQVANETT